MWMENETRMQQRKTKKMFKSKQETRVKTEVVKGIRDELEMRKGRE